ncbi:hypothetical protein GCM10009676_13490 [Prauserella halophila]|uniref:Uncharacterized protein n=1 Tax=Prauserella halophila TaxID=185641 RepID=A0ABN1W1W3_9PSEU|nr:hypothetical protein [Prauserella halophila]MCP2236435.1 hypothetical protein [Prauserella halophila]
MPPTATTGPTPPAECVWNDELADAIRELVSNPARWSVVPADEIPTNCSGYVEYDNGNVSIDEDQPCDRVADIVRHEWTHAQQVRLLGGRVEIVADCGS